MLDAISATDNPNNANAAVSTSDVAVWDAPTLHLSAAHAEALAELVSIMLCAEASAALVFEHMSRRSEFANAAADLKHIAAEEHIHHQLISRLQRALPAARCDEQFPAAIRGFFRKLASRDVGVHFARIVALDSAACWLLGALRRNHALSDEPTISMLIARIHADEARHVVVARRYARELTTRSQRADILYETRMQFAQLLLGRAPALEALAIDPMLLLRMARCVPRGVIS